MRSVGLVITLSFCVASIAHAQGVTLDQYRAADTPLDGFVVARPRTLGHLQSSVSLHVDYGLAPLRVPGMQLVDHELAGQVGAAIGLFDRLVIAARLPVVMFMSGAPGSSAAPMMRDPLASGPGLGDLALALRYRLVGEDADTFALALRTEATIPLAEAISSGQDLQGEAGVTFTPSLAGELRFAPVRITANVGARFRQAAIYRSLAVRHELTWGLAISVDLVPDVLEAMLEGYGATPFDRFATASVSPVEAILGLRVRPVAPLFIGLAGGAGIGDAYGNPELRGVLMLGWADVAARPTTAETIDAVAEPTTTTSASTTTTTTATETEVETVETTPEPVGPTEPEPEARVAPPGRDTYGQLDRDGDRLVDAEDQCVLDGEDYDEVEDPDGCPEEDADHDAVPDDQDACPLVPGVASTTAEQNGCPARAYVSDRGTIVITSRIEFASGSDRILRASEAVLTDVAAILQRETDVLRVRVEGHTDDRGRDATNLRLSTARAASVRRWLVAHGIAAERIEAWGCGELHPLETGTSTRARQANRRVEFFITDPMTPGMTLRDQCVEASP